MFLLLYFKKHRVRETAGRKWAEEEGLGAREISVLLQ